jgi:hypothetical protein
MHLFGLSVYSDAFAFTIDPNGATLPAALAPWREFTGFESPVTIGMIEIAAVNRDGFCLMRASLGVHRPMPSESIH